MKVKLKKAIEMLRINQSYLSKEINMSRQTISHYMVGRRVCETTKTKIEIVLNLYRNSEIERLQKEIELLKSLEWDI